MKSMSFEQRYPEATLENCFYPEQLKISAASLVEAHEQLGATCSEDIQQFAWSKLHTGNTESVKKALRFSNQCLTVVQQKAAEPTLYGQATQAYLDSLAAWGSGARLDHHFTEASASEIAFWLQNENVGCMSAICPIPHSSQKLMIHFEEYRHNNRSRLVNFNIGERQYVCFHYAQLLPGSGFSLHWTNNSTESPQVQSTDSKFVTLNSEPNLIANIPVWITTFAHEINQDLNSLSLAQIIKSLGTYIDGYSTQRLQSGVGNNIKAEAVTFAHDKCISHSTEQLYIQGNTLDTSLSHIAKDPAEFDPNSPYQQRDVRWRKALSEKLALDTEPFMSLKQYLADTEGGEFANANPDVWASLLVGYDQNNFIAQVFPGNLQPSEVNMPPVFSVRQQRNGQGIWETGDGIDRQLRSEN